VICIWRSAIFVRFCAGAILALVALTNEKPAAASHPAVAPSILSCREAFTFAPISLNRDARRANRPTQSGSPDEGSLPRFVEHSAKLAEKHEVVHPKNRLLRRRNAPQGLPERMEAVQQPRRLSRFHRAGTRWPLISKDLIWWRRGESNPRPEKPEMKSLRA